MGAQTGKHAGVKIAHLLGETIEWCRILQDFLGESLERLERERYERRTNANTPECRL